mmetsp:Transcript_81116/g.227436  ORF Transcript_81116/g.227436 Transcript_81116/m.227436 type:complete len:202 (+) Transcript_81116:530-1135(+)
MRALPNKTGLPISASSSASRASAAACASSSPRSRTWSRWARAASRADGGKTWRSGALSAVRPRSEGRGAPEHRERCRAARARKASRALVGEAPVSGEAAALSWQPTARRPRSTGRPSADSPSIGPKAGFNGGAESGSAASEAALVRALSAGASALQHRDRRRANRARKASCALAGSSCGQVAPPAACLPKSTGRPSVQSPR